MTKTEIALTLHACGIVTIPLLVAEKIPAVPWEGLQYVAERPTEHEIRALWADHESDNVAMLGGETSRLWIVDADIAESFMALQRAWPQAPWVTITRRGGHFCFHIPDAVEARHIRNMVHIRLELPNGDYVEVDTRSQGGYVVTPGSVHPKGHVYASPSWPWKPEDRDRLPVFDPEWRYVDSKGELRTFASHMAEYAERQTKTDTAPTPTLPPVVQEDRSLSPGEKARRYVARCPGAVSGNGGDTFTFSLACRLVRGFALSESEAFPLMAEWNVSCSPPWSDSDLRQKISNAAKYGKEALGGRLDMVSSNARAMTRPDDPDAAQAPEAEGAVLGACLVSADAPWLALQHVDANQFYATTNGEIFRTVLRLLDAGTPVEARTVAERLKQNGCLEVIGGTEYLTSLVSQAASNEAVEHFAKVIAGKARLRAMGRAAARIATEAKVGVGTPEEIIDRCSTWFMGATDVVTTEEAEPIREAVNVELRRVDRNADVPGVLTYLVGIDQMLGGLKPEELTVIAARPSMGKTALGLTIARQIASEGAKAAGFFSLEMSREQVSRNLLGQFVGVSPKKIAEPSTLSPGERQMLSFRGPDAAQLKVIVDPSPGLTVLQIRAKARRMLRKNKAVVIIVDYLQLIKGEGDNRADEVGTVAKGLKQMARELKVPVVALAQLNRMVESRDGNRPRLSDIKESGGVEEAADVVMLLWREGYYKRDRVELAKVAELIVAKNRNGPTGAIPLVWEYECMRFGNPR